MEKPWIIEAVKAVYFVRPTEPLHKSDIDSRITKFCITHYMEYHPRSALKRERTERKPFTRTDQNPHKTDTKNGRF